MEKVGLQLVADGADAYLRDLTQGAKAEEAIAAGASKAAPAIDGLGDATKDAGKGAKQLGDDVDDAGKKISLMDKITTGAAEKVGHLLTEGFAAAGQAVVQFATDGVKKAGDFEAGMNRFASVTGGSLAESGKSLQDFQKLFIQMGRDLPVSTAEVQQAAIEMAKGGIEPATIAAGGLRTALDLAAAGELGIAQSAEILSKQMGVWVDKSADAATKAGFLSDAANLLSQAANASTVNVDDLALGLANTGKSADIAGLSFRETVTSMALISSGFSSAADAGTSFKTFLGALQPKTDAAANAFKTLNLLTEDGKSKFYDATGAFIGMDKAAGLLKESLTGMSDAQKIATLNAAFGQDAIRTAGMLADAGADGYAKMAEEMLKVGSVAAQAAKKQQGFNVAIDNMMGSLEAFQITVGTGALPLLTTLVNLLSSGINAITDYADATMKGETALALIAGVIKDAFVPALYAAGAALALYAYTQIPAALTALPALVVQVSAATTAFIAQAAAVALAAAPFVLIAAVVGGAALVFTQLQTKVEDATTAVLNSKTWWLEAGDAIDRYAGQTGAAKDQLAPYAATIEALRTQIQGEVEDLGKRSAAGTVSDAQMEKELATIRQHRDGLAQATDAYNAQEQAIIAATAAGMTATAASAELGNATADLGTQVSLTAKDIEDLGKQIQKTFEQGQSAVQSYATNQAEFLSGVEQRQDAHAEKIAELEKKKQDATTAEQKQGIDDQITQLNASYHDQEEAAANSYARQQAAQTQHLGQMLIDYTVAQASLGNISKEKAAEITAALEKEYGLQESSVATTFLHMAGSIDKFAASSGESVDTLTKDLKDQQHQAADTQRSMDNYAKTYTAEAVNNFADAKLDALDYTHALEDIPTYIETTVVFNKRTIETYERHAARDDPEPRASGGNVSAMQPYLVGERGPELIIPSRSGTVIPASETRTAIASLAQISGSSNWSKINYISVDARGSTMTPGDVQRAIQAGLRAEGDMADIRIRTGVL